jgi:hypothetical protein
VLRWSETVLEILAEAGIEEPQRAIALRALLSYVIGAIQLEHLGPLSGAGTEAIAETARDAVAVSPDEEFRGGLRALLRGLGG